MINVPKKNIDAAIIGFWRQGATLAEIGAIFEVPFFVVERIVEKYKAKLEKEDLFVEN